MTAKEFIKIYDEYSSKIPDPQLMHSFDELHAICQNDDVMLITVIGTLKAGKSTFMNVLTHSNIYATDSTECTIRPTFVYPSVKASYKAFSKISEDNFVMDVRSIMGSFFGGNDDYASMGLRNSNIDYKIDEESVKDSQNGNKDYLFTSFGLDATYNDFFAKYNGKKIIFVDMPGDNGPTASNKFDDFYNLILKRTDLVLFVFKDDIDKSVEKYLDFIIKNNKRIPFVQILNKWDGVFEDVDEDKKDTAHLTKCQNTLLQKGIDVRKAFIVNPKLVLGDQNGDILKNEAFRAIVDKRVAEYREFEKFVFDNYLNEKKILEITQVNYSQRVQDQFCNLLVEINSKIDTLKTEKQNFNNKILDIEKIDVQKFNIAHNIQEHRETDDPNIADFAEDYDKVYLRCNFIPKIAEFKEKYLNDKFLKDINGYWVECQQFFRGEIKKIFSADIEIDTKLEISYEDINNERLFNKKFYERCVKERRWLYYYSSEDLQNSLCELENQMYNRNKIRDIVKDKFKNLKQLYIDKVKEQMFSMDNEMLLATLQDMTSKLK